MNKKLIFIIILSVVVVLSLVGSASAEPMKRLDVHICYQKLANGRYFLNIDKILPMNEDGQLVIKWVIANAKPTLKCMDTTVRLKESICTKYSFPCY